MAETIYVRGEGGSVIAMDLPLADGIKQRFDAGHIVRVNPDGSDFVEPAPAVPEKAPAKPRRAPAKPAEHDEEG